MPGTSVSHLIWFIAAITVAIVVASALTASVLQVSEGVEDRTDVLSGELRGDVEIVNDPQRVPYDQATSTLTVYLKNTGSSGLEVVLDQLVAFVNGTGVSASNATLVGSSPAWNPGTTLELEFQVPGLVEGVYYHMKVTASRYEGVSASTDFMVRWM